MKARSQRSTASFASNVLGQLIRGISSAALTGGGPLILVHILSPTDFNAWALAFGLSATVVYLDLGLQSGLISLAARRLSDGRTAEAAGYYRAALSVIAALVAMLAVAAAVLAMELDQAYPQVQGSALSAARFCLVVLVIFQGTTLLCNVAGTWFAANRRSLYFAARIAPPRIITLALLAVTALLTRSPVAASLALLVGGALATFLAFSLVRRSLPPTRSAFAQSWRPLLNATGPAAVWSVCTLVVSGLDLAVVGAVDYPRVGAYSIAISVTAITTGLLLAIQNPVTPLLAVALVNRGPGGMLSDVRRIGRAQNIVVGAAMALLSIIASTPALGLIAGDLTAESRALLLLLAVSVGIRLWGGVLAASFLLSDRRRPLLVGPVAEATTNLAASIPLGIHFGAQGVAIGTMAGAVVGLTTSVVYTARALYGSTATAPLLYDLLAAPAIALAPFAVAAAAWTLDWPDAYRFVTALVGMVLTGLVLKEEGTRLRAVRRDF